MRENVTVMYLEIPLRNPFSTAGGTIESRGIAITRVGDGPFGWGEAAPYPGQDESMVELLDAARVGVSTPTLAAALDEALSDLEAKLSGESFLGIVGVTAQSIPVSLAVGLDRSVDIVERAVNEGVSRFKLKIGPERLDHVVEIREKHNDVVIGLDANGSFDTDTIGELEKLSDLGIAYLEEPVREMNSEVLKRLRSMTDAALFADESVRTLRDAEYLLSIDDLDGVVIKPGRLGWSTALTLRDLVNESGKLWRASGLIGTGVGRAFTDVLAGCHDAYISDVAPAEWYLERDIVSSRHEGGQVVLPSLGGVGVEPDMEILDEYLVASFSM